MPEFIYAGQLPASYTETRDSGGFIVGTVEHGDTREFGDPDAEKPEDAPAWWCAPDGRWVPAGTEIAEAWPGVGADMYRLPEADAEAAEAEPAAETPAVATEPVGEPQDDAGSVPEAHETGAFAHLAGTGD